MYLCNTFMSTNYDGGHKCVPLFIFHYFPMEAVVPERVTPPPSLPPSFPSHYNRGIRIEEL